MKTLLINKNDLRHNINEIKKITKQVDMNYKIIAVVKGNGYGLDLIQYSKFLIENGISLLAVATVEEALKLSKENLEAEILMLSSTSIKEELEQLTANNITVTIGSENSAKILNEIASTGRKIKAHIKIDTGFGRYGFLYTDCDKIVQIIKNLNSNIEIDGIFTHFSIAYAKSDKWTNIQFERFMNVVKILEENNINIKLKHVCNSTAFLKYPQMRLNAARIGSAFVGRIDYNNVGLIKIGKLETNITEVKNLPEKFNIGYLNTYKTKSQTKIAIAPIGYFDGFNIGNRDDMFRIVDRLRNVKHDILRKKRLTVIINEQISNR